MAYSIEMLSLSKIGRLLKERLGDSASQYLFPDDFEQAVADIDFTGVAFSSTSAPYDVTLIGKVNHPCLFGSNIDTTQISSASWVGVGNDDYTVPINMFFRCVNLTTVTLPTNTTSLGTSCFNTCSSLTTINNLSNVTTFGGGGVFCYCTSLVEINLPKLTAISDSAFSGCTNLKRIYLPSITSINRNSPFSNCTSLEYLQLGSVGNAMTVTGVGTTSNMTQSNLTIDVYAQSSNIINTLLTNLRNKFPNATIVFKASADTTYNNNNYDAGDTILTSTPS